MWGIVKLNVNYNLFHRLIDYLMKHVMTKTYKGALIIFFYPMVNSKM